MNTTSFQTNQYNHAHQTQIQGQSGLKIFAGEDLSNYNYMQPMVIVRDCSKCNPMFGGGNKWRRNRNAIPIPKCRRMHSMPRPNKYTTIENN